MRLQGKAPDNNIGTGKDTGWVYSTLRNLVVMDHRILSKQAVIEGGGVCLRNLV